MHKRNALLISSLVVAFASAACDVSVNGSGGGGGQPTSAAGPGSGQGNGNGTGNGATSGTVSGPATTAANGPGATGTTGGGPTSSGTGIGEWIDAPGACPSGATRVDLSSTSDLADASRGEGAFAGDAPDTCYFIHDGEYVQESGVLLYFTQGGTSDAARRWFVGESRDGVVIRGRASIGNGVGDLVIANLTFDLTGYAAGGAFNTLSIGEDETNDAANITVDHVTFTGDCATGLRGGHVEVNGAANVLVDSCIIEKFGQCQGDGHEDHGVYLASGSTIVLRNNVIRENSSRGVQLYTQGGDYGTLDDVTIERNRIERNGHRDYEDGIVMNGSGTGTVSNVHVTRNLIVENRYSGLRFAGGAFSGIVVDYNTFVSNGQGSSAAGRSEVNIDDEGGAANTTIGRNVFSIENVLINDCYGAESAGFAIADNFVSGPASGSCLGAQATGDPGFVDAAGGDFHTTNPDAEAYGAFAP